MKILMTNDDGIMAPALPMLIRWARTLGEVTCIAPKVEQSGMSQAIDFTRACEVKEVSIAPDITALSMDSTPADCVRFGILGLHKTYDLVISGINRGLNLGHDIVYSGTVGAIFEGARLGHKGIAFSTDPDSLPRLSPWQLDRAWTFLQDHKLLQKSGLYNINFPSAACPARGICLTRQGGMYFSDGFQSLGNDMYIQVGAPVPETGDDLTVDIDAIRAGYISVTPLTETRTDWRAFDALKGLCE